MRIGFLGIQCDNPNLGVSALAYSAVNLVHAIAPPDAEFVLFSDNTEHGIQTMKDSLRAQGRNIRAMPFRHRSPGRMVGVFRAMRRCALVIDFTGGDSFSDIYGTRRLVKGLLHKQMAILGGAPLILAPQTYGPFAGRYLLPWVKHVVRRAALVFSRDLQSAEYLEKLTSREVLLSTDVAVTLPWRQDEALDCEHHRPRVGLNVSGLLWAGGYTGGNQFGLRSDYKAYCRGVIGGLLEAGHEVHLVAHVVPDIHSDGEGEAAACRELQTEFPAVRLAPRFSSPIDAKSWIAGVDVFIGARMHATIASFTAGVPTVPVAYSQKFGGLFGSLGYDVLVDLRDLGTEAAVASTLRYVSQREDMGTKVVQGTKEAEVRISVFPERLLPFMVVR